MPAPAVIGATLPWADQLVESASTGGQMQPDVVGVRRAPAQGRRARRMASGSWPGALDVRQGGHPALGIAHHDELAHLCERDEPLVLGFRRHGVQEQRPPGPRAG
jgi:hypothetical protein